jgi:hypothetical protein
VHRDYYPVVCLLDRHALIGKVRLEGTAVQLERRDEARPWRLAEVRHQDVTGCS